MPKEAGQRTESSNGQPEEIHKTIVSASSGMIREGEGMTEEKKELSSSSMDGIRVILTGISFEERPRNWTAVHPEAEVENLSGPGVTEVTFRINLLDETGAVLDCITEEYAGIDRVLRPGERVSAERLGGQKQLEKKPVSASVTLLGYKTEEELPPVRLPHPGEFLFQALNDEMIAKIQENPPVSITCHIDRGGVGHDAVYTKENGLKEALRAFCAVKIRGRTDVWVTDNYNYISLEFPDGTRKQIQLNMYNLELQIHNREFLYQLDGIQNLFMMDSSIDLVNEQLSRFRQFRSF